MDAEARNGTRSDLLVDDVNKLKRGGNGSAYLLRRLAREAPDVLERYEAGEFKSARAAAIKAKIIKEDPPFKQAEKLIKKILPKLTPTEKRKLKEMLD
jgi:hypothetical protein